MFSLPSQSQIRCGTVEYQKLLHQKNPKLESTEDFEHWLADAVAAKRFKNNGNKRENAEVIEIPVVVHIIHNGESIGVGKNIDDAQIFSQIDVLNKDFRRLNNDASNTPAEFQSVAADIEIEFKLAQRDPEGLPTTGINRLNGGRDSWFLSDNVVLKSLINWPPQDYLNIWVTQIDQEFLGYAQFPVSNSLGGLQNASMNEITDGIVIHYRAFGSIEDVPTADLFSQYNLGRTATHEVGHYLGLRHIWGDNSSCAIDDFVADTPPATRSNNGLGSPCSFPGNNTCNNDSPDLPDMFQNYMDFSDDVCMNLFTSGQKDRIRIVLDNSPRRISLASSKGALPPEIFSNDVGIRNILSPGAALCDDTVNPQLEIRNYGDNTANSFSIQTILNGSPMTTDDFNLSLGNLEIVNITLSAITLNPNIENELSFIVISTNGLVDGNPENDTLSINTIIPSDGNVPFSEDFNSFPAGWTVNNVDGLFTWEISNAPKDTPTNQALSISFFDYEIEGELDLFESPILDLSSAEDAILFFDVAYSGFAGVSNEGLFVTVTTNCEDPVFEADTVFFKLGSELSTTNSSSRSFVPSGQQDWRTEVVNLRDYLGQENLRISFIAQNAFGNNLYIDNVSFDDTARPDIGVDRIVSPSVVSCQIDQPLIVEFRNTGTLPLGYFEVEYELNNNGVQNQVVNLTDTLGLNETVFLELEINEFNEGNNVIDIRVSDPNQLIDVELNNNALSLNFLIESSTDILPLKERFESFSTLNWSIANPDADLGWESGRTNKGTSVTVPLSQYERLGEQDWLVSPIVSLANLSQATLNFDVAYSFLNGQNDQLDVLISTDCGSTYFVSDFQQSGSELKTGDFTGAPSSDSLWQNISISLNDFIGLEDVRIAFVSTNANGNDIFIDNIQVFTTTFFIGANNNLFPNPTLNGRFNILFELDERETVEVVLYDVRGNKLVEVELPNTLNQIYEMDISSHPQGIYLIQVRGETFSYVRRVMHGQ